MKPPGDSLTLWDFLKSRTFDKFLKYETLSGFSNSMGLLENKYFDKYLKL